MSKRNQKRAAAAAPARALPANRSQHRHKPLSSSAVLLTAGCVLLLAVAVIGAAVSNIGSGNGGAAAAGSGDRSSTSAAASSSAAARAVNPVAVTTATPQLSKEYIYAGSRMLAVEEPGLPDVVVTRITPVRSLFAGGTRYTFTVEIKNIGTAPVTDKYLGAILFKGDEQCFYPGPRDATNCIYGVRFFDSFAPGATAIISMNPDTAHGGYWENPPAGETLLTAVTDDVNRVAEANENNNRLTRVMSVDAATDLVVWRPQNGGWYILDSAPNGGTSGAFFGTAGDVPVPADFDGDGLFDLCVFRVNNNQGEWHVQGSISGIYTTAQWGSGGDKPAPADYDGDGRADFAVYRSGNKTFYILHSTTNTPVMVVMPDNGIPVSADYDGDGRADAALYGTSNSEWHILQSASNTWRHHGYGDVTLSDIPTPGDYDGDGKFDIAIRRDSGPIDEWGWHILPSTTGVMISLPPLVTPLEATDKAVVGDYDRDGKTDIANWRPLTGTWYIRQSSKIGQPDEMRQEQWGANGDTPVPAPMKR